MIELRQFKLALHPALEVVARSDTHRYRCTKCSNAQGVDVRHYSYSYNILDSSRWAGMYIGPLMYFVTAVFPSKGVEVPRYVGIWKGNNLEGRWTRVPRNIVMLPGEQRFIHHSYDTQRRLEIDYEDFEFRTGRAFHRVYVATTGELHIARSRGSLSLAEPYDLSPIPDGKLQYARLKQFESSVTKKMHRVGLQPWNGTSGNLAVLSSLVALAQNTL